MGGSVPSTTKKVASERRILSEDKIFDLLSNTRRRELLRLLKAQGGTATIEDLTWRLSHREFGEKSDTAKRKAVYVALYQSHIPRLVEAGVIAYDDVTRTVRLTGPSEQLYGYLEFDPTKKTQWLPEWMQRRQSGRKAR